MEPHDYGEHNGVIKLLTWQIAGSSTSPLPNWRWMEQTSSPTLSYSIRPSLADVRRHPASITNGTSCSLESSRPVRTRNNPAFAQFPPLWAALPKTHGLMNVVFRRNGRLTDEQSPNSPIAYSGRQALTN